MPFENVTPKIKVLKTKGICKRKTNFLTKIISNTSNSQKRPGSGYALNQCGFETQKKC